MAREHTDKEYEAELRNVRERLLRMGAKVEELIANSMHALLERDSALASRMIEHDHQINRLEVETDELCLRILARRQPVASDLRFLTIALKLVTDLERIGDLGVNICERVIELNQEPPLKPYIDLPEMAEVAQGMVREALDAFVARDVERAQRVIEQDRVVDAYYAQVFRELLTYMMENPRNIHRATRLQSIAKYLERIGDHATNLAEMVVFMVKGKDIRHLGRLEEVARHVPHGVLFLSLRDSVRGPMAEGWARKLLPPSVRIWTAGTQPVEAVNPRMVPIMREVGVDLSTCKPKRLDQVPWGDVDTAITLCAEEPGANLPEVVRREAWGLSDPLACPEGEVETALRSLRDELRRRIEALVASWA